MLKKLFKGILNHSQIALSVTILLVVFITPYYSDSKYVGLFNFIFFSLILLSSILTFNKSGKELATFGKTGYLIIVLVLVTEITKNSTVELVTKVLFILFMIYVAVNLLILMIKSREVDSVAISSAIGVYLLFGFCGALITMVVLFFQPDAFSISVSDPSVFHQCLYFSFITITTTGYGDVLPLQPIAKTLAIFLALFGNLYLTVIIGILIGKYLSDREKR
jgi:voltage-gated potassium channel